MATKVLLKVVQVEDKMELKIVAIRTKLSKTIRFLKIKITKSTILTRIREVIRTTSLISHKRTRTRSKRRTCKSCPSLNKRYPNRNPCNRNKSI